MGLGVAEFLPDLVPRSPGGDTTVLVTVHSGSCRGCRDYLDALAASAGEFEAWGGRLVAAVPGPDAGGLHPRFGSALPDPERRLASGQAAVAVADRYGHIFHSTVAGASHELPAPREIEEWLKYLGTLCPE